MEGQELRFALLIPEELAKEIEALPPFTAEGCAVERRIVPSEHDAGGTLGFDPIAAHYLWLALKFVGTAAATSAAKVLFEDLFKRLKRKGAQHNRGEVTIRFPNGTSMTLPLDDRKAIEEAIEKNGGA